jgi:PAS domain S-box-containing protein
LSQGHIKDDQQADPTLAQSAEELYEMAPCGYLTTTTDGRIVKTNRTLTEWLGYERDELTQVKRLPDLLTAGGRIFYDTHLALLLRMQRSVDEIALDLICKDGRLLPTLINARQKRNAAEEPVLEYFTIFNASERRMYERELLAARDLFRTTLASIGDGVIATDADGRVTFINQVANELTGRNEDAALGKPIEEVLILVREDTGARIENPVMHALRAGATVGVENDTVLISRDGRHIPIEDSAAPIRGTNGDVVGCVLVLRDISVRRNAERELQRAHEQLARRAAELRRSNEDLSRFAYVASHDLRSPVSTITQYAQLLERKYGSQLAEGKELLQYLMSAAIRMSNLIEDLLSYASVSADETHPSAPVQANLQLGTAIENLRSAIDESAATITHDLLPEVLMDATSLIQLFQNLIANAIRYRSADPPFIHVAFEDRGAHYLFSCRDNGIGIAPEFQTQIFEPFKRLHGADRPGSGIGLAVCKRIVERYRGRIWVESDGLRGSTFLFTLPKAS